MQIMVPISSRSPFFPKEEFFFPKPLIEIGGMPMIEMVIRYLRRDFPDAEFCFVIEREDGRAFSLDHVLRLAAGPGSKVVERQGDTSGALCSCLLAIDAIDPDKPLLVVNSDQIITAPLDTHVASLQRADAGVVTFNSVHPRWSYVLEGDEARVEQAFEKRVVSRHAVAGVYYFSSGGLFVEAAQRAILNDAHVGGAFYLSASINEVILMNREVVHSEIPADTFHSFYTPGRIATFERSELTRQTPPKDTDAQPVNVIIPAAGEGSRFAKAGWKKPKPFIDVAGRPMLSHVIDNVAPPGASTTLLLRRDHVTDRQTDLRAFEERGATVLPVDRLTEGTACTVLLARKAFDGDRPMMVANSDQLVDFDVADFLRDCRARGLDGSILVFRDPDRDPKWSFAKTDAQGLVTQVAEKKPISDLATVGIYLFSKGSDFVRASADMLAANERVNGEFYTCPVYNYMIRDGARIGVYEVPSDSMHGLGTPEDLTRHLEKTGAPPSADRPD